MIRICFVCLGNICRSPTAEGVMRKLVADAGFAQEIEVDSAGTGGWHVGEPPDPRSMAAASRRGLDIGGRARQFKRGDWQRFDYVIAMDPSNLETLERAAPDAAARAKLSLLRAFDPDSPADAGVPDPYYSSDGFDEVIDLCLAGCAGLLEHVRRRHGLAQ